MALYLAYAVVILSVEIMCKVSMIRKVAYTVLGMGVLGIADNIGHDGALLHSCLVVGLAFIIFIFKGGPRESNHSDTKL